VAPQPARGRAPGARLDPAAPGRRSRRAIAFPPCPARNPAALALPVTLPPGPARRSRPALAGSAVARPAVTGAAVTRPRSLSAPPSAGGEHEGHRLGGSPWSAVDQLRRGIHRGGREAGGGRWPRRGPGRVRRRQSQLVAGRPGLHRAGRTPRRPAGDPARRHRSSCSCPASPSNRSNRSCPASLRTVPRRHPASGPHPTPPRTWGGCRPPRRPSSSEHHPSHQRNPRRPTTTTPH